MSYGVNRGMEHKRHNDNLEYSISSGEAKLCKRVRRHGSEYQVTDSTAYSNEYCIEYVSLFNENEITDELVNRIKMGENIAVVSDAGMPAISDPGWLAAKRCIEEDVDVVVVPGVSAGLMALVASGIPCNNYYFAGFLNSKSSKRKEELKELSTKEETIILYEAPHRIKETLELINETMGNRYICLARELTKKYEEFLRGTVTEVLEVVDSLKGEMVLIISGAKKEDLVKDLLDKTIKEHHEHYVLNGVDKKEALKLVAKDRGIAKSIVYQEIFGKNKN